MRPGVTDLVVLPQYSYSDAVGDERQWYCEAYGPGDEGCFVQEAVGGRCADLRECHRTTQAERQLAFDRIHQMAVAGDEIGIFLAQTITSPEQLLRPDIGPGPDQPD